MRSTVVIGCTFAVTAAAAHFAHRHLDSLDRAASMELHETLPSEEALQLMGLTYDALLADYYWLKTVNEFGDVRKHAAGFPNVVALTRRVLALDPKFKTGYAFAGTALTVDDLDPRVSVELLEKGLKHRPDLWQVPFYLGFNLYYFIGDFEGAAENMARAATVPGAPEIAGHLATRLAAQARRPEVGIQMIDSILETVNDERLRETYLHRRKLLLVELHLIWLGQAIEHFRARTGACPQSITELVTSGLMRGIPDEPLGGAYRIEDCAATTTSDYEELRVHGATGTWKQKQP